jgi:DNA-binding XRE family transcriptional regulator
MWTAKRKRDERARSFQHCNGDVFAHPGRYSQLRVLRCHRKLTQDELAAAAGINVCTYRRIEKSGTAAKRSWFAIARALGVKENEIRG